MRGREGGNIKQTELLGSNLQFMFWRISYLYSMSNSCLAASYLQGNQEALLEHQFSNSKYVKSLSHTPRNQDPSGDTLLGEAHVRTRVSKSVGLDVKQTFPCPCPSLSD